jgi:hypothetical protein
MKGVDMHEYRKNRAQDGVMERLYQTSFVFLPP